ncbi:hypothetical protein SPRG_15921 [Saprolegnia parasitica CBS 223.65]|uniref:Glycosyl transferase family 1 domain-containing protein n=1 Tax=Saprolegnia parasitica (strain CBS 223.65) TaxID=695850 RepID=A0A067BWX6_SAPPC|nr:hypothetical protein SPRG_15921 [Saprolegnia parasitica CBS 223.65]KDO18796.1 hypothetical protein SPRG_15921 [Saprolegnia parasitica CBS 223.65]|eukprot:XP_012210495.1 hypothetical protein SPRG_15921 [Saprolegnia parasitica CBS 223.65]
MTKKCPAPWCSMSLRFLLPGYILVVVLVSMTLLRAPDSAEAGLHLKNRTFVQRAPTPGATCWFDDPKTQRVPTDDLEHLSFLHAACTTESDDIITWQYGTNATTAPYPTRLRRDDPRVLDELRRCPDYDVFLPSGLRGSGYCEDGCAYAKYGQSRLLPIWALEDEYLDPQTNRKVKYFDLCPRTPVIFFNHYWPPWEWPKHKPIYLMPNIEMGELKSQQYWSASVVICKSRDCYRRVTKWYEQEGNPNGAAVFYTRHTTADIAGHIARKLGPGAIKPKDYRNNVRFTHSAGGSVSKGTDQVIECWLARPDLPPLDLSMSQSLYDMGYGEKYAERIAAAKNINFQHSAISEETFGKRLAETSFFLCASRWEGYGHYINQARAAGGVIITTDAPPMNELIVVPESGVYAKTVVHHHPHQIMGGRSEGEHGLRDVSGLQADYSPGDLCNAVNHVLRLSGGERERMAKAAQQQYHDDTKFFATAMRNLRAFARVQLRSNTTAAEVAAGNWQDSAVLDVLCV